MRVGAAACAAGGAAWIALASAAAARRSGDLGYETYFRLLAIPLLLFAIGFWAFRREWDPREARARWGANITLGGLAFAFAGTTLEFWGVLFSDKPTAHDAPGGDTFWGSEVGLTLFILGFFALLVGGTTATVRIWRSTPFPRWIALLVGTLGFGIIFGNVLSEASLLATVPVFGVFGAGWIALGRWLWLRGRATAP